MLISNAFGEAQTIAQTAVGSGGMAAIAQAIKKAQQAIASVQPNTLPLPITPDMPGVTPAYAAPVAASKTPLVVLGVAVVGAVAFAVLKSRRRATA